MYLQTRRQRTGVEVWDRPPSEEKKKKANQVEPEARDVPWRSPSACDISGKHMCHDKKALRPRGPSH